MSVFEASKVDYLPYSSPARATQTQPQTKENNKAHAKNLSRTKYRTPRTPALEGRGKHKACLAFVSSSRSARGTQPRPVSKNRWNKLEVGPWVQSLTLWAKPTARCAAETGFGCGLFWTADILHYAAQHGPVLRAPQPSWLASFGGFSHLHLPSTSICLFVRVL